VERVTPRRVRRMENLIGLAVVRPEAERLAAGLGISAEELLAEAQRVAALGAERYCRRAAAKRGCTVAEIRAKAQRFNARTPA
jgi:hypothetical protein